jgi:hypothetical protein
LGVVLPVVGFVVDEDVVVLVDFVVVVVAVPLVVLLVAVPVCEFVTGATSARPPASANPAAAIVTNLENFLTIIPFFADHCRGADNRRRSDHRRDISH